ncbi:MAG: sensor histidine kinase [Tabrizicola sp.]|nr:sensor histidine kinase [Tabrizicola sp.]
MKRVGLLSKGSSLGARLGWTLVFALLPLGVLTVIQAQGSQRALEQSTLEAISGLTRASVQRQIDLIKDAQITARAFAASLSHALEEGAPCVGRAKAVAATIPTATLVAYIPLGGLMTCSSTDAVYDFGDNPLFQKMTARPEPSVVYNPMGPVSGQAVVGISHPVFDAEGTQVGVIAISLPYVAVAPNDFEDGIAYWRPEVISTVTGDGTVLLSSTETQALRDALPAGLGPEQLPDLAGTSAFLTDAKGAHVLSVTEVADDLYLVSQWQRESTGLMDPGNPLAPYFLPALTWIAALVAAGFASSQLVVRHVQALSRSMSDYLRAHSRVIVPNVTGAPLEIQHLHEVYEELVRTIEQEEAELRNLVLDKETLLREVNHRSGNSLQIIASVMRMYRREASDPELVSVLDSLINRVIALSSTHTSLYDLSGRRDVPLNDVLFAVVQRLKAIHRVAPGAMDKRFEEVRVDAQTTVIVAMAVAEALSCFFAVPTLASGQIHAALTRSDGTVMLRIEGPSVPAFGPETTTGIDALPGRLLRQLARQLAGTVRFLPTEDGVAVELSFPVRQAEAT